MMRIYGRTGTLLMGALVAGCSGDTNQAETALRGTMVAAATAPAPTPVSSMTAVDTTPVRTDFSAVSYSDAEAVFRKGRYGDAAEMFSGYVGRHPENAFGHYMLGLSAWKSDDRGRATTALERAVELDSTMVKARTNLGRVLLEQGRAADALPHVERAVELSPESHEVWRVLGNVQSELGLGEDALESYRQALVINERDAWSMNNYGLVLINLGRFEEALPPLARAVELMPGSPVFHNNLGVALERSGEVLAARRAFRAAVAADSTYRKAQVSLARVQALLGDVAGEEPDLGGYARAFEDEIQLWRTSRTPDVHCEPQP